MNWEHGKRYVGVGVDGLVLRKADNDKGTLWIEGVLEVVRGPMQTERIRYRGYVNSLKNAESTATELRAGGWRGGKWGDWSGWGSKEVQFTCMIDQSEDGKKYPRATFLREPMSVSDKQAAPTADLDALNRAFGALAKSPPPQNGHDPTAPRGAEPWEADPGYDDAPEQTDIPI